MAPNVIFRIGMLFHLSSGIVLRNLALTKGRGEMCANSLTSFGKRIIWTYKMLLKTLSSGEGEEVSLRMSFLELECCSI